MVRNSLTFIKNYFSLAIIENFKFWSSECLPTNLFISFKSYIDGHKSFALFVILMIWFIAFVVNIFWVLCCSDVDQSLFKKVVFSPNVWYVTVDNTVKNLFFFFFCYRVWERKVLWVCVSSSHVGYYSNLKSGSFCFLPSESHWRSIERGMNEWSKDNICMRILELLWGSVMLGHLVLILCNISGFWKR